MPDYSACVNKYEDWVNEGFKPDSVIRIIANENYRRKNVSIPIDR